MSEQLTQEQMEQAEKARTEWVRTQFQKANEHLASKGIVPDNVTVADSRYLPPYIAVWKLNTKDKQAFWVISGDVPTDHMALSAAKDAREAVRAFSLQWQLKAQQIIDAGISDKTQQDFANLLITRAHGLYELFGKDELWQASSAG
jgi:glutathione S-transferase